MVFAFFVSLSNSPVLVGTSLCSRLISFTLAPISMFDVFINGVYFDAFNLRRNVLYVTFYKSL